MTWICKRCPKGKLTFQIQVSMDRAPSLVQNSTVWAEGSCCTLAVMLVGAV